MEPRIQYAQTKDGVRSELLGDWNWYFLRWLEWLPEIHIEEAEFLMAVRLRPDSTRFGRASCSC